MSAPANEFEKYPALASWIERLASTNMVLSLGDWVVFLGALNNALLAARAAEGSASPPPPAEGVGKEEHGSSSASLPAHVAFATATEAQHATGYPIDGRRFSDHAGARYRHVKRGTAYALPFGRAEAGVQCSDLVQDGDALLIYIGDDGMIWARPPHEFFDGRFERLPDDAGPSGRQGSGANTSEDGPVRDEPPSSSASSCTDLSCAQTHTPERSPAGKSLGERLCDAFQAARPPSGWCEPLVWDDFDDSGQASYERAAAAFLDEALAPVGKLVEALKKARLVISAAARPGLAAEIDAALAAAEATSPVLLEGEG